MKKLTNLILLFILLSFSVITFTSCGDKNPINNISGTGKPCKGNWLALSGNGIAKSVDGINWIECNVTITTKFSQPRPILYIKGIWVTIKVNPNTILTSPDGITWTKKEVSDNNEAINSIAYGNNKFVAVGDGGTILTSDAGETWTKQIIEVDNNLRSVAYGNNKFVAVGEKGTILTTIDGTTWGKISEVNNTLRSVAYGNNQWIVGGHHYTNTADPTPPTGKTNGAIILTSNDGTTWKKKYIYRDNNFDFIIERLVNVRNTWVSTIDKGISDTERPKIIVTSSNNGLDWELKDTTVPFLAIGYKK